MTGGVKDRLNTPIDDTINERSLGGTDYDVWIQTNQLLKLLQIKIRYCQVKGHQADRLKKECGMTGPLERIAHYNEFCDKLAEEMRDSKDTLPQKYMHPASMIALHTGKTYVTASV